MSWGELERRYERDELDSFDGEAWLSLASYLEAKRSIYRVFEFRIWEFVIRGIGNFFHEESGSDV